jgi:bifunctional non-homologous end joining protein LigD
LETLHRKIAAAGMRKPPPEEPPTTVERQIDADNGTQRAPNLLLSRGSYTEGALKLPQFISADPKLIRDAFDHEDFVFELKMDGFRAVAHIGKNETRLLSKGGRLMQRFANLAAAIRSELNCEAIVDGEIVVLDSEGRPCFYDLMRGRGQPVFYVFDLLWLDGKDQRSRPLLERKRILRSIVPKQPSVLLYAHHVERYGIDFFRLACELDLEGIVAKRKVGAYGDSWFKIRNPVYSQYEGRRELFEKKYATRQ